MSKIGLVKNIDMGAGFYPAFTGIGETKSGVDNYFGSRIYKEVETIGDVLLFKDSEHLNSGNVHIEIDMYEVVNNGIGGIKFSGPEMGRTFYGLVSKIERVNSNSCRIYFEVDWVASYWDKIKLNKSLILVRSEKEGKDEEYSNTQQEPIGVTNISYKLEMEGTNVGIGAGMTLENLTRKIFKNNKYVVETDINTEGKFDDVKIVSQCGGIMGGYQHVFDANDDSGLNEFLNKIVEYTRGLFNSGTPVLKNVQACYLCPTIVYGGSGDGDVDAIVKPGQPGMAASVSNFDFKLLDRNDVNKYFGWGANDGIKNNKTMNHISYTLMGSDKAVEFSPFHMNNKKKCRMYFILTGGLAGYLEAGIRTRGYADDTLQSGYSVKTPNWPRFPIVGTKTNEYFGNLMNMANPKEYRVPSYKDGYSGE